MSGQLALLALHLSSCTISFDVHIDLYAALRPGSTSDLLMQAKPSVAEFDAIGNIWAPYRSLGSYYMWRLPIHQKPAKRKPAKSAADPAPDVTPSIAAAADVVPSIV